MRYDRYDCNLQLRRPLRYLWLESLAWFGGLFGLYYVFDFVKMSLPTIPQQYPNQGKVHYTFELEDNWIIIVWVSTNKVKVNISKPWIIF